MQPGARIDYKALRRINPEAARLAVLEYLTSSGHNVAATARAFGITSEQEPLNEALRYIYYYNNLREHSSLGYKTPYQHLKQQLPDLDENIRFVVPILLDKVAVQLGPWSGYHVLAQHPVLFHCRSCLVPAQSDIDNHKGTDYADVHWQ